MGIVSYSEREWLLIILHSWEALSPEQCTLIIRPLPELQKPVWRLEDFMQMYANEMESSLTSS